MVSVGPKIRKIRELRDLTQSNMSAALGISQTAYSKIERGESDVAYSTLKKIAELLDIDVLQLLAFEERMIIHRVGDYQQGGQAGFVINQGLDAKERELYMKQIEQLIAHNQQLISENQQLRIALNKA